MDCDQFQQTITNLQDMIANLQQTVNQMQTTISNLHLLIGFLVIGVLIFLTVIAIQQLRVTGLRKDNRELIRRLEIISRGKVIN